MVWASMPFSTRWSLAASRLALVRSQRRVVAMADDRRWHVLVGIEGSTWWGRTAAGDGSKREWKSSSPLGMTGKS